MLFQAKCKFFNTKMTDCGTDSKAVFQVINEILHRGKSTKLPDYSDSSELADRFGNFFSTKISMIRDSLEKDTPSVRVVSLDPVFHGSVLDVFEQVSQNDIATVIKKSATKSCMLDPIPTWMLKDSLDTLLPPITTIVNMSMSSGEVPTSLKKAVITPLLKKPGLDRNVLKNYRPVSNLSFVSKVIERVVTKQLTTHMNRNNLHEPLQSAYKEFHSTETALIKVQNDILLTMDRQGIVLLLLLDLSAAFDTIDHTILLSAMDKHLGIRGKALQWFASYLAGRTQCVTIDGKLSCRQLLKWGVPQGSVLGPILFVIYILPLGNIIRRHGLELHCYADDTQVYIYIRPVTAMVMESGVARMEDCVSMIQAWMAQNMLKLNADKTEVMLIGHHAQLAKCSIPSITIGGASILVQTRPVRNLGVIFDMGMDMAAQVSHVIKTANLHLHNIGKIRKLFTLDSIKKAVHAMVTSRMDYCNALLCGISNKQLQRLQLVQNSAARLITGTRKFDHITTDLIELHWLPIKQRIDFKILVLVFKAQHEQAPRYICDMIIPSNQNVQLRSASKGLLLVPRTKCRTFGDRAFAHYAPNLWNKMPYAIKTADSLDAFKTALKTYLFLQAYPPR